MHVVGSMLAGSVSRIMKYLKERRPTEEGLKVWDIVTRHRCLVDLTTLTAPAFPPWYLQEEYIAPLLQQAVQGLQYLHSQKHIHR